jgi:RecB family exonuclease
MLIPSWSHSRVVEFEKCKYRTFLMQVDKVPEPERPLPPGKTEHANDRGSRIHDECEQFVRGTRAIPSEANKFFRPEFEAMRRLYDAGKVSLEGEWGMNRAWEPTPWRGEWKLIEDEVKGLKKVQVLPDYGKPGIMLSCKGSVYEWVPPWLRLKLDALVHVSKYQAIAIDYKTGKKFGNELKHAEQLQLYQLVTLLRYPELEEVTTELWYLDADELTSSTFTRSQGLRFMRSWDTRGNKLTTCTEFPPNPNIHSCRYCGYGPWGTGHCAVGKRA